MCILYLLVGDITRPTLICNNRDEYYGRKTERGDFDAEGFQYSPLDVEGGGTWLSAAGLDQSGDEFRYAVVLNYQNWRESHPFCTNGEKEVISHSNLKSRGLLIKNFMGDLTCSAKTYANIMFKDRALYRPFNLIVSDKSGTFYVSSSRQQRGKPEQLQAGRLYGISNGYMHDTWEKTHVGRLLFGKALIKDYKMFTHAECTKGRMPNKKNDTEEFQLAGTPSLDIKFVMLKLMQVMKNDTPLSDATFGQQSAAAMQLGSIFVRPTLILRQRFEQRLSVIMFIIRAIVALANEILQYLLSAMVLSHVDVPPVLRNLNGSDWYERIALFIQTATVLGILKLPQKDQISGPFAHKDLFGTRTITVIYHMPRLHPPPPKKTSPSSNTRRSSQRQQAHANVPAERYEGGSDYCIMEKDLNPVNMTWSTNEFSNMQ